MSSLSILSGIEKPTKQGSHLTYAKLAKQLLPMMIKEGRGGATLCIAKSFNVRELIVIINGEDKTTTRSTKALPRAQRSDESYVPKTSNHPCLQCFKYQDTNTRDAGHPGRPLARQWYKPNTSLGLSVSHVANERQIPFHPAPVSTPSLDGKPFFPNFL